MKTLTKPAKEVSYRMSRVRSHDTKLEREMSAILKNLHVKFEGQPDLPGHPDFRIKGTTVLIFCDSSFWHGRRREDVLGQSFRKNREFWANKIASNRRRDFRTNRMLREEGWTVLRFWDTDILKRHDLVTSRLKKCLE